jgi:hypothetical protein
MIKFIFVIGLIIWAVQAAVLIAVAVLAIVLVYYTTTPGWSKAELQAEARKFDLRAIYYQDLH